jgi:threonine dehydrogenase-like Zn-dependent dehydrogenase
VPGGAPLRCARWGASASGIGLAELQLGEPPPGWLRLRVLACGICGSDLHAWRRLGPCDPEGIPGHEFAGVLAPGAAVLPPRAAGADGELFAVEPRTWCGQCARCRAGLRHLCAAGLLLGVSAPGGLADAALVPLAGLHPVPRGISPRLASLAEPLAVALRALGRSGLAANARALVLGGGTLGLLCGLLARERGAHVGIAARHPAQMAAASALGLAPLAPEELAPWAREAQPSVVFETVGGEADTLEDAVQLCAPGGTVVVLGLFPGYRSLDARSFLLKELRLVASNTYATGAAGGTPVHLGEATGGGSEFASALSCLPRLAAELALLQTHQFALSRVGDAFECAADKRAGAIKVTVLPGD